MKQHKVLLVDDEPSILRWMRQAIEWEKYGFKICGECSDGQAALEKLEHESIDLVISDIRMPELDGIEMIRGYMGRPQPSARFIIVSGYDDFTYVKQAFKLGVRDYLLKPIDLDELLEVLVKLKTELSEVTDEGEALDKSVLSMNEKDSLFKIKCYIDQNYKKPITLKSLADLFFVNHVYLGQQLKKYLGTYFTDYLLKLRIDEAKRLLRTTNMKIYAIAMDVGYKDKDYFAIKFEEQEQMKPSDYRKLFLKDESSLH
ncbi:response regulator transcription factor [Paenibacillus roseipurpureus]|uniref:Response regulator n=1 Tax=Paenibacillus roseopurpureus TaxID=2918901 RepID=A0AA96LM05_9BACL|nr:response regulator [Paenibacillus sp. MBLB1832]WNR43478.1 response regulator [Paenibacillus sp. MBLB1832]